MASRLVHSTRTGQGSWADFCATIRTASRIREARTCPVPTPEPHPVGTHPTTCAVCRHDAMAA